jgi:hypothetical protein
MATNQRLSKAASASPVGRVVNVLSTRKIPEYGRRRSYSLSHRELLPVRGFCRYYGLGMKSRLPVDYPSTWQVSGLEGRLGFRIWRNNLRQATRLPIRCPDLRCSLGANRRAFIASISPGVQAVPGAQRHKTTRLPDCPQGGSDWPMLDRLRLTTSSWEAPPRP